GLEGSESRGLRHDTGGSGNRLDPRRPGPAPKGKNVDESFFEPTKKSGRSLGRADSHGQRSEKKRYSRAGPPLLHGQEREDGLLARDYLSIEQSVVGRP